MAPENPASITGLLILFGFVLVLWLIAKTARDVVELRHEIEKCKMVQISQQKVLDALVQDRKL